VQVYIFEAPIGFGGVALENNKIKFEFLITERDYIKLFVLSPSVKSLKRLVLVSNLGLSVIAYLVMIFVNVYIFGNRFELFSNELLAYTLILFFVASAYSLFRLKSKAEKQGKDNYEKFYNGQNFSVVYNQETSEFLLGKRNKTISLDRATEIISTPDHYFFYCGNRNNGEIFLIPKKDDDKYKSNLNTIINDLKVKQGLKIREKQ
jgi:hypothetical protein